MTEREATIRMTILEMEKPFKISDLFDRLAEKGIKDQTLIRKVLNQLLNVGLVEFSDVVDDIALYYSTLSSKPA